MNSLACSTERVADEHIKRPFGEHPSYPSYDNVYLNMFLFALSSVIATVVFSVLATDIMFFGSFTVCGPSPGVGCTSVTSGQCCNNMGFDQGFGYSVQFSDLIGGALGIVHEQTGCPLGTNL